MHVIEKLKHDIKSFPLRMLRARLLNAERWELKTGGLEEKVSLLKLRYEKLKEQLRKEHGDLNEDSETKEEVSRQEDQWNSSSEGLRNSLAPKKKKN